ncbi:MAG: hypothetical protein GF409_02295 [Candidatus Omnitrophica bacterium]|nr:hypothetical protein [Candidatus Omnitrophota bacterium]
MLKFYRKKISGNIFSSMIAHVRDFVVSFLPITRLPNSIVKLLYGFQPDYVFLIHPRRIEDILVGVPYFRILKKLLPAKLFLKLVAVTPAYVVGKMTSNKGINGLLVTNAVLPSEMLRRRRKTLQNIKKLTSFIQKISKNNCVVGLGAWWPIVSRRGIFFKQNLANSDQLCFTNGHCGTLISIYLAINRIAELWKSRLENIDIAIIGSGKMGTAVAKSLLNKVRKITLIDKNKIRLERSYFILDESNRKTKIDLCQSKTTKTLYDALSQHRLAVCTTSNITSILRGLKIPVQMIIIDDSRPEAFPRTTEVGSNIVLEGGLVKINGINVDYDFGFGKDENVFGCLAEAFVLALEGRKELSPTLGDVDFVNFYKTIKYYKENGITTGDFKSGDVFIRNKDIVKMNDNREEAIAKR